MILDDIKFNEISDRLTGDQWRRLSLGDYDNLIKEAEDNELIEYFELCRSHLHDQEEFKKKYRFKTEEVYDFPKEYTDGFTIDNRLQAILNYIRKYNARDVLDIGSRAGFILFHALKHGFIDSATGVEIDTGFYNLCKRAIDHYDVKGIELHNTLFEDFESDKKFDVVLMTDTLEHVIDPQVIFSKSKKFLKDTGIAIVSVPIDRPPIMEKEKIVIKESKTQEHVHLINLKDIIEIGTNAGFGLLEAQIITSFFKTQISVFKPN